MKSTLEIIEMKERKKRKTKLNFKSEITDEISKKIYGISSSDFNRTGPEKKRLKLKVSNSDGSTVPEPIVKNESNCGENNIIYNIAEKEIEKKREQLIRNGPKLRLKTLGESASLSVHTDSRTPLFLTDIQHLLLTAILGNKSPCLPTRWYQLEREDKISHNVVVVMEGLTLHHYFSNESKFEECNKIFKHKLEVIMPPFQEGCVVRELLNVQMTKIKKNELIKEHGSLEAAIEIEKDASKIISAVFPTEKQYDNGQTIQNSGPTDDLFPRTKLLLSALQMVDEGYPLPLRGELANKYKNYVMTKDVYAPVTPKSPMFGLDCEMCQTITGVSELTRISIVNESYQPVYETLVLPKNKITNYLTRYSGITAEIMSKATKSLQEVQNEVRKILPPDAILVGQSLNSDLHAMKMMHPYVIDTSVIFNVTGIRQKKTKLQTLARIFLGEDIQTKRDGHDSTEDCLASLKLAKLKLSKGIDFGDEILQSCKRANDYLNQRKNEWISISENLGVNSQQQNALDNSKKTSIICSHKLSNTLQQNCSTISDNPHIEIFPVKNNKKIIRKSIEIIPNNKFSIINLSFAKEHLELSEIDKTLSKIDRWISTLWQSIPNHGLFIVIFGSSQNSSNGCALIKIKKDINNKMETSITLSG